MSVLKIAMVQQKAVPNDPEKNLALALEYTRQAWEMGADLVLFPELWSNGYAPPFADAFSHPRDPRFAKEREEWLENALDLDSAYIGALRNQARKLQVGIVATYLSKTASKPQNTAIVIDRGGNVILEYAKVHTCDFSLECLLQGGDAFKVCTFDGVRLGVMICYDREFPESARILMLQGAEIILVPNACDMNPARLYQLRTRAFENMVGIAMANYPAVHWGCSCGFSPVVFDQNGAYCDNTILMADDVSQQILIAGFDLTQIRAYRNAETWGNAYRKPHAYAELLSRTVVDPFVRGV